MDGQFSNLISVVTFLKRYLEVEGTVPELKPIAFSEEAITSEKKWVEEVNASKLCSSYLFCDTHSAGSSSNGKQRRPDITAFPLGNPTEVFWDLAQQRRYEQDPKAMFRDLFYRAALIVERKLATQDGFVDDPTKGLVTIEKPTQTSELVRGQLIDYNVHHFSQQPRVSSIQLLLIHKHARLIHWDRAGAVVTEAFEWTNSPLFAEFLYRFNVASREQRGLDTSVRGAAEDSDLVKSAKTCLERDNSLPPLEKPYWVYTVHCEGDTSIDASDSSSSAPSSPACPADSPAPPATSCDDTAIPPSRTREFLVGRPVADPRSFTGRSSTGFIAYDVEEDDVAYLKDAWFPQDPDLVPEGAIYRKLQPKQGEKACLSIPTLVCAGRVWDGKGVLQATVSQEQVPKDEQGRSRMRRHVHTRTVVREVGAPMIAFSSVPDLLRLLCDTVDALEYAYKRRILHRDISAGNVMIKRSGDSARALLVDWDLALDMDRAPPGDRSHITGTWQFMSVPLLMQWPGHVHCFQDDLESTFWLLIWCLARFTDIHPRDDIAVMEWVHEYFDQSLAGQQDEANLREGGNMKQSLLVRGGGHVMRVGYAHKAFRTLFKAMAGMLRALHEIQEHKAFIAANSELSEDQVEMLEEVASKQVELGFLQMSYDARGPSGQVTFEAVRSLYEACLKDILEPVVGKAGTAGSRRTHDRYKQGRTEKAANDEKEREKKAKEKAIALRAGVERAAEGIVVVGGEGSSASSRHKRRADDDLGSSGPTKIPKGDRTGSVHQSSNPSQRSGRLSPHIEEPQREAEGR